MLTNINDPTSLHRSHLFTVRLWLEVVDEHQMEMRGQVQHTLSGEARYFRDWETLIDLLAAMFSDMTSKNFSSQNSHSSK